MKRMIELNKLYYFYIAARYEHMTNAAKELHIAQPALTKAIKVLEQDLGVALFYRRSRRIFLTEAGKHLKMRLDGVFDVLDKLPSELEELKKEEINTVNINVLAASTVVTEAIVNFKKKNKQAVFQVIQNEEETNCDISITTNSDDSFLANRLERSCIIDEKIFLAVPKNFDCNEQSVCLKNVRDRGFVNLAGSRAFRSICDSFCFESGFKPKIIFESDSPVAVKNMIGAGIGIGFWPEFSWGRVADDIRLLPIEDVRCQRSIVLRLHNNKEMPNLAIEFYDYLVSFLKKKQLGS